MFLLQKTIVKSKKEFEKGEQIRPSNYKDYVEKVSPKSKHALSLMLAFLIGGLICVVGQVFIELYKYCGIDDETASILASCTLIALAAISTGFGFYDKLGRFAGTGSTIPITGFSNAVVAPALEFRSEGLIYGLGAKMFVIAGPVIVNGVFVSTIIALISMLFK